MASQQVNLAQASAWFNEIILPQRTTVSGFSGNRLWKSPRGWIVGHTEDPNGLCGDATLFVVEEFYRTFRDYRTTDGFHIGMVLWEGDVLNHMAAVMLIEKKGGKSTYSWDKRLRRVQRFSGLRGCFVLASGRGDYSTAEFLGLQVYDLYNKQSTQTLSRWWDGLDGVRAGTVTIGMQHEFA